MLGIVRRELNVILFLLMRSFRADLEIITNVPIAVTGIYPVFPHRCKGLFMEISRRSSDILVNEGYMHNERYSAAVFSLVLYKAEVYVLHLTGVCAWLKCRHWLG